MKWVKTSEELPPDGKHVLIKIPKYDVTLGWYGSWDRRWRKMDRYCPEPSHWAEIPDPP